MKMALERRYSVRIPENLVAALDTLPGARATHVYNAIAQYIVTLNSASGIADAWVRAGQGGDFVTPSHKDEDLGDATTMTMDSDPVSQSDDYWSEPSEPRARIVKRHPPQQPTETTMSMGRADPDDPDGIGAELESVLGDWD